jgi:hypothetical protein
MHLASVYLMGVCLMVCVSWVCLIGIRLKVIYFMGMHLMGAGSAKTPTASSRSSEFAPELARPRQAGVGRMSVAIHELVHFSWV